MRSLAPACTTVGMPEVTQLDRIESRLARLEQLLVNLTSLSRTTLTEQFLMASNLDSLVDRVTQMETVQQSAITLLGTLADEIRNLTPTQEAINALADRIDGDTRALAAAVEANTPGAQG